jgi:predicted hotdog family 3-hydroxylacyl-ACP dehydratase
MAPIGRDEIAALIPHAGRMCLLEWVESWSEGRIQCRTDTHRDPQNPLRHEGALAAVHLAEYGAQAMAVHGGLLERARGAVARPGLLVALRDLRLHAARIDDIATPLTVRARRLLANADGWLYAFEVEAAGRTLASGRAGVIHAPPAMAPG